MSKATTNEAARLRACGDLFSDIADHASTVRELAALAMQMAAEDSDAEAAARLVCAVRDLASRIGGIADVGASACQGTRTRGLLDWLVSPAALNSLEAAGVEARP